MGRLVPEDEGSVGQLVELRLGVPLRPRRRHEALAVELGVDRVGANLLRVEPLPDRKQAHVVVTAAFGAWAMTGRERRHLVEEEELGVAARLQKRVASPPAELEPAGDPPLAAVAPAKHSLLVVQAAAIAVDEPATGRGDELAERGGAILQRAQTIVSPPVPVLGAGAGDDGAAFPLALRSEIVTLPPEG